jgi:hypothetical protein
MVAGTTIEVAGRWSAWTAVEVTWRWSTWPATWSAVAGRTTTSTVAGGWSAGTTVTGRTTRTAARAPLALHSRWARGSGVRDARPYSDTCGAECTAEHRSSSELIDSHNQAFPRR